MAHQSVKYRKHTGSMHVSSWSKPNLKNNRRMNRPKAKGDQFERDVVNVMREAGIKAQRTRAGWADDQGDIETPELPIAWQCKNMQDVARALREGVDGAQEQAANSGDPYGVAVVKRRLKGADEAYAVLPLNEFLKLIS